MAADNTITTALPVQESSPPPAETAIDFDARRRQQVRHFDEIYGLVMAQVKACQDPRTAATLLRLALQILKEQGQVLAALEAAAHPSVPPSAAPRQPRVKPAAKPVADPAPLSAKVLAALAADPPGSTRDIACVATPPWPTPHRQPARPAAEAAATGPAPG